MRITQLSIFSNAQTSLAKAYQDIFQLQNQITTGKKVNLPSDQPSSVKRILELRSSRAQLDQIQSNLNLAESELSLTDGVLQNMSDLLTRAREIGIRGANGIANADDQRFMADEVDGILQQYISLANTRGSSGFLFGGALRDDPPFELVETEDGDRVFYRGDEQVSSVDIGSSLQLGLNLPGSEVFSLFDRQPTTYSGNTGAAPGSGTDSIRGSDRLLVRHTATTLGDGLGPGGGDSASGLLSSSTAPGSDTVLGSGNVTLTINDTSGNGTVGTVSINGGPTQPWSAADTNLAISGPNGELLHLDFSAITPGFSGDVAVSGDGELSLDGGLTTTAIDFSDQNQIVVDSESGESIFLDATGITLAGEERLSAPGSFDTFAALIELRDRLRNADGLDSEKNFDAIRGTLVELERGQQALLSALGEVGARVRLLDLNRTRAQDLGLLLVQNQAELEDVDLSEAAVQLASLETVLQASISVTARITSLPTLVNVL